MTINEFIEELNKINIKLSEKQLNQLEEYYNLLIETNKELNLTSITEKKDVYLKHFYDSLTLIKAYDLTKPLKICDIGTGAGFPGLVLKIVFPNLQVTLIDALEKRIKFLNSIIQKLNLIDIEALHERAEIYSKNNKGQFDIVTSRAVAKTNILLEISSQLIKIDGYAIFLKANIDEELKLSQNAIKELGFYLENTIKFKLPKEDSTRTIVVFKKISQTKNKYPREFNKIKKSPL